MEEYRFDVILVEIDYGLPAGVPDARERAKMKELDEKVTKVFAEVTGLTEAKAKDFVGSCGATIVKVNVSQAEADAICEKFHGTGAVIEVGPTRF